jgi:hypothetical protein
MRELESLLSASATAREFYVDLLACDAELHWTISTLLAGRAALPGRLSAAAETGEFKLPVRHRHRSQGKRSALRPLMLIAALAIVAVGVGVWHFRNKQPATSQTVRQDQRPAVTSAEPVARLTRTVGAFWQDAAMTASAGNGNPPAKHVLPRPLSSGQQLKLLSGLVEVEYATGARIILQGPAEYVIGGSADTPHSRLLIPHSPNAGYLSLGKLAAHVPPSASGFTIASPDATVKDLGTEFAMLVEKIAADPKPAGSTSGTATEVHVLTGHVDVAVRPASLPSQQGVVASVGVQQSEMLSAGQALRIASTDQDRRGITPLSAVPEQFVRELSGPQGKLIAYEDWESIHRGEPASQITGWFRQGFRFEPPIQLEYANPAEPSLAPIFGHNVLRFQDDDADAAHRNSFIYRLLPNEVVGRPLSIRFDYRCVRDGSAPKLWGLGLPLRLAPELAFDDLPPLATIRTGDWYRLTLDIPALDMPREIGVHLTRLTNDQFTTIVNLRVALLPQPDDFAKSQAAQTLNLGFAPAEKQALGGLWELDNIEVRVRDHSRPGRQR